MPDAFSRIPIGNTDLEVPQLGLGTAPLGGMQEAYTNADAHDVLAAAWEEGIRFFDTAPWYGTTQSEHRVGAFLRDKPRDEFVLTTKVGRVFKRPDSAVDFEASQWRRRWPGGLPFVPHFDYSADWIQRSYEDSLTRLGLNRVDALAIHDLDQRHHGDVSGVDVGFRQLLDEGGFDALSSLKKSGEIGAIGVGINLFGSIPRFVENFDIDYFIVAMPYTLLDQDALDTELAMCIERNISVIIGAPYASGILATGAVEGATYRYAPAPHDVIQKVQKIEAVCRRHGVSLGSAALQLPMAHPAVASIIPGADIAAHVRLNMQAVRMRIPGGFWQELKSQKLIDESAPVPED